MKIIKNTMIIIALSVLGFFNTINASDGVKINASVSALTNYVLFGKTVSDNKQAINSIIQADYKGVYTAVHTNSVKLDNKDALQVWYKLGYSVDALDGVYIKANYVKDAYYGTKEASGNDGDYGEIMFGSTDLKYANIGFYNLYNINNSKWFVHSASIQGNINENNSIALTAGVNVDELYFYEVNYSYKVNNYISLFARGVFSDYINLDKSENFLLAGVNFSF